MERENNLKWQLKRAWISNLALEAVGTIEAIVMTDFLFPCQKKIKSLLTRPLY
jgi:hypothetical protein